MLRTGHKARWARAILLPLAGLALSAPAVAQELPRARTATVGDAVSAAVATALLVSPRVFGWGPDSAGCAPCDPQDLLGIDRVAVHPRVAQWDGLSTLGLFGLVGVTLVDLGRRGDGLPYMVASLQAALWTEAVTEALKAGVGRERPVLYTSDATPEDAGDRNNVRSFPSGHTSVAFSLATSYWLSRRELTGSPGVPGWLAVAAAGGVGVMRIAAGKHFPSDVLAGAALGMVSAIVVHVVRF